MAGWMGLAVMALEAAAPQAATPVYFPPPYAARSVPCEDEPQSNPPQIVSTLENTWFSRQLAAAQEPSLYLTSKAIAPSAGTTARFTWLPTFDHPVIIRVTGLASAAPRLIAKQLSGAGGYGPGKIDKQVDRALTSAEVKALTQLLKQTDILTFRPRDCRIGLDGSEWLVEGVDSAGYHFREAWSPDKGPVRDVGMAMLTLTGWTFPKFY